MPMRSPREVTRTRRWRIVAVAAVAVVLAVTGVVAVCGAIETPAAPDAAAHAHPQVAAPLPAVRRHLSAPSHPVRTNLLEGWRPKGAVPAKGQVSQVVIPATASHFDARPAMVYLPPAALVANAPRLPVIIALSGQPGSPDDMFRAGQMPEVLDAYAAAHHGLAPIVVVPDQLGSPKVNPMCVNSPLGNVATYITQDVPAWIRAHLKAEAPGRAWAIAGFSEGGTCSIQFGAARPDLFGTILDISGEAVPTMGADTVKVAFGGSQTAYDAAMPVNVLAAHAPYDGVTAIFGVGQTDAVYTARMQTVMAAARAAGMATSSSFAPGTGHVWPTVRYLMGQDLPVVSDRLLTALGRNPSLVAAASAHGHVGRTIL